MVNASVGENLDSYVNPECLRMHVRQLGLPRAYRSYGLAKANAMDARLAGNVAKAQRLERNCDLYYKQIPADWRW